MRHLSMTYIPIPQLGETETEARRDRQAGQHAIDHVAKHGEYTLFKHKMTYREFWFWHIETRTPARR